ncbi:hypothetical protein [Breznakibacter xylanolyticus]|uniref:hypothetical protein n=1 Tax=Breznakibacter xylanolyticus TaxID=990 RepID=UPI000DAF22B2
MSFFDTKDRGTDYVLIDGVGGGDTVIQPNAENRLNFSIEGFGIIASVGNANLKYVDTYIGVSRKAWHGRALVVIRSTRETGVIKLTVSSPGLPDEHITINSIQAKSPN